MLTAKILGGRSIAVQHSPSMREVWASSPSYVPGGTTLNLFPGYNGLLQLILVLFMFPSCRVGEGLDQNVKSSPTCPEWHLHLR